MVHDVCLQNLNVNFFLDRGGLVGEDGATHHGVYDFSFLRHIPNLVVMAPKDEAELARMMATAFDYNGPCAVRYPRGTGVGAKVPATPKPLPIGEGELMRDGTDAAIITIGSRVYPAVEAAMELVEDGLDVAVFNTRFVKPLPEAQLLELAGRFERILLVEENALAGRFWVRRAGAVRGQGGAGRQEDRPARRAGRVHRARHPEGASADARHRQGRHQARPARPERVT